MGQHTDKNNYENVEKSLWGYWLSTMLEQVMRC